MAPRIAHLTSVHSPHDTRIFHKECRTLAEAGYEVVLIVPHDRDKVVDGVRIRAVPEPQGRLERITRTVWHVYQAALDENAQIYHFHDPELIPVGLLLKARDKTVIYDVHEDYVTSIEQKNYLPSLFRPFLARIFGALERLATKPFEIILAEKYYARRFRNGTTVLNYPIRDCFQIRPTCPDSEQTRPRLLYTGVISKERGALLHARIVNMMSDVELYLIGRCSKELADGMRRVAGGGSEQLHIEGEGFHVPYERIVDHYMQGGWTAGLAVFPPTPHYMEKGPTKFFEYMSAGIPIVCSDFPFWRQIIEEARCGLLVDPLDPQTIVEAIRWLLEHPQEAEAMGRRGQQAVQDQYNWSNEAEKLLTLYRGLLEK